ncbi:MAG: NUDIX domain-containing protein [Caldilineaceae bacterium]
MKRKTRYQGAIIQDHHILLIRNLELATGRTYWLFPGGGLEEGESEEACVVREMKEETNLTVKVERLVMDQITDSASIYQQRRTYLCSILAGTPAPGYEPEEEVAAKYSIIETGWFDLRNEASWHELVRSDAITYPQLLSIRALLGY